MEVLFVGDRVLHFVNKTSKFVTIKMICATDNGHIIALVTNEDVVYNWSTIVSVGPMVRHEMNVD